MILISHKIMEKNVTMRNYLYKNKGLFICLLLGNLGVALSLVLWSYFMKSVADAVSIGEFAALLDLLMLGLLFLLVCFVVNYVSEFFRRRFLYEVNTQLRNDLFHAVLSKDINSFAADNSAKYISILNNDMTFIENDYFMTIPRIVENVITAIVAFLALIYYHPLIAVFVVLSSLTSLFIPKLFGEKLSIKREGFSSSLEVYNKKIKDLFSGFELIKSFNADKQFLKIHRDETRSMESARYAYRKLSSESYIWQEVLVYFGVILMMCLSVYLVLIGQITLGVLLGSMQLSNYVTNPLSQLGDQLLDIKSTKAVRGKVEAILNSVGKHTDQRVGFEELQVATPIHLRNLCYSYNGSNQVLKGITLKFEEGKKYALVGDSGSGKSTLLKLMMNYYSDYEGDISLGNQCMKTIDRGSFYNAFATIHQNAFMFDASLRHNITLFQEYSDHEVRDAVKRSGLQNFVQQLHSGVDTNINEGGSNISGGEQQRISIARALLKEASVLLVDEATSSLDNKMAIQIERLILEQTDLTAIVVTHKLVESVLRKYDKIIALRGGIVEEVGTFDELIKREGYFHSLYMVNHSSNGWS